MGQLDPSKLIQIVNNRRVVPENFKLHDKSPGNLKWRFSFQYGHFRNRSNKQCLLLSPRVCLPVRPSVEPHFNVIWIQ